MKKKAWIVIAIMVLTITGCGSKENVSDLKSETKSGEKEDGSSSLVSEETKEGTTSSSEVALDTDYGVTSGPESDELSGTSEGDASESVETHFREDLSVSDVTTEESPDMESTTTAIDEGSDLVIEEPDKMEHKPQAGQLTAGEWNDNIHFDFFMDVLENNNWYSMKEHWDFVNWKRFEFEVVNNSEQPIIGANIRLMNDQDHVIYQGKTNNKGYVALYPYLNLYNQGTITKAEISYEGLSYSFQLSRQQGINRITLQEAVYKPVEDLELMLMIDTTGSMSDELEYLKSELQYVIQEVQRKNVNKLNIRLSANFYRDIGDEYVVRSFSFTGDLDDVVKQIENQSANGGGDFEEAVVLALEEAIYNHQWSKDAGAKLLFLVLDAPPHHTPENIDSIHQVVTAAVEEGIRIIPIASSGIDKETEFLLRFMETETNGTYIFLTDHSGIGGDHLEPTIGQYQVEQLNDLLIRVIGEFVN